MAMTPKQENRLTAWKHHVEAGWNTYRKQTNAATEAYRLYNEQMPEALKKDKKYKYDLFIPLIHMIVQAHGSRVMTDAAVMRLVLPSASKESKEIAQRVSKFINWQASQSNYDLEATTEIWNGIIAGTAIGFVHWEHNRKNIVSIHPDTGKEVSTYKTMYQGPKFIALNHQEVIIDPAATSREDMKWGIRRVSRTMTELRRHNELDDDAYRYRNLDMVDDLKKARGKGTDIYSLFDDDKLNKDWLLHLGISDGIQVPEEDDSVICHEWYDLENWRLIIVAFGKVVILDKPIPFSHGLNPFVIFRDFPVPFTLLGKGVKTYSGMQRGFNALFNLMIESVALGNRPLFVKSGSALKDDDYNAWFNGGVLALGDVSEDVRKSIMQINLGNAGQLASGNQFLSGLLGLIEKTSFTSELSQGAISSGETTATEAAMANNSLDAITNVHLRNIYNHVTVPVSRLFLELNKQFLPNDFEKGFETGAEREWITVTKADFDGVSSDDFVKPVYEQDQARDQQAIMALYQMAKGDPSLNEKILYEMLLESMGIQPPYDDYYTQEEEIIKALQSKNAVNVLKIENVQTSPEMMMAGMQKEMIGEASATHPGAAPPPPQPIPPEAPQQGQGGGQGSGQ